MAKRGPKRKGKARRRIKDWHSLMRRGAEAAEDQTLRRQRVTEKGIKIPTSRLEAQEEHLDELPKAEGMVIGFYPGGAHVRLDDRAIILCGIAKAFRPPEEGETFSALAMGDRVTIALTRPLEQSSEITDQDRADAMIVARQLRKTLLARPQPRSRKRREEHEQASHKVIAANMDLLLVVLAVRQPPLRRALIDRFHIVAQRGDMDCLLAINKIDIERPDESLVQEVRQMGLGVVCCSAMTGEGIDELLDRLAGRRSVLAGPSGVGKSSLVNQIIPSAQAHTRTVRQKDERGRHTTSASAVYDLPDGGMLVDTPGVRELGVHLDPNEVAWFFPEIMDLAPQCTFNDCLHTHEPGCAVIQAVEDDKIPPFRYESYLRILETAEENW